MAPYRRKRRPSDCVFLPADAKAWRKLIAAATAQARAPLASQAALDKAGKAARQAVMPDGNRVRGSVFSSLTGLALTWWRLTSAEREAQAVDLLQLAEACAAVLDRVADAAERPPRADIYG